MRKIILGLVQTILTPFIIIIGYYAISFFEVPKNVEIFSGVMGAITIVFNWLIGILLIIKGYQEAKVFKEW
jgi:hypothetical protein